MIESVVAGVGVTVAATVGAVVTRAGLYAVDTAVARVT